MSRSLLIAVLAAALLPAMALADDEALIREEERDAASREQAELAERIHDLEAQHAASKALADKQQQLIEALQAQIQRLEEKANERQD